MSENSTLDIDKPSERRGWQHATPYLMFAAYVLGPLVLIPAFGGQRAVVPVLILIFATAAIAGFVDGLTYRFTWSLPILAGFGFGIAKWLYFNDGTFIYALGCTVVAAVAAAAGQQVSAHRLSTKG